ncbi:helix-turn-helix domain-containing protein [Leptospira kirschneri]|nr:AraC family transcriptional regulator [Leptospira kirschneri]WBF95162.1 helix-turn-helix domain-containing protein [Leptospira kirschneri]
MKKTTDFNLFNIALECGFNSASSFHSACVKFTVVPRDLKIYIQSNKSSSPTILQKYNQILKAFKKGIRKRLLEFKIQSY